VKIDTELVNTPYKEYTTQIDWRSIMNYAAAINDDNPYYFNDEREDGIVAHPMFAVAVTWPIIENLSEFIISKKFPIKVFKRVVHYYEHLIIHRLIQSGDQLKIKGKIVALLPHRAGTLVIQQFEARDKQEELVFTEFMGGLLRGIECKGEPKGMENLPIIPPYKPSGNPIWDTTIHVDKLRSFIYDGCTNIFFPIHTSKKFAHFVGLRDIILQGTATLAFAVKEIINREANKNPHKIQEIACKFTGFVFPATNIQINLLGKNTKERTSELFFEVSNEDKKKVIKNGFVLLKNEL